MTAIAGYQSDLNLQDIEFVGDFPLEHNLGGYGETSGATDDYALTLDPAISQYRVGMRFQVKFNHPNGGVSTVDVDGKGAVPLMKIVADALVDLEPNDLNDTRIYDLIYDGVCLQVITGVLPLLPLASEVFAGVAEIATQAEVDAGVDNARIVTPQKLLQFVSDKITGLWENKGFFDCSTNPNYPAAVSGDAYTVSVDGKIGGAAGIDVEVRDVFYCINDNPGGDPRNPATIADNVGDNVGDVAGMGADLFGSYVATVLASMVLGNYVIRDMGGDLTAEGFNGMGPILLPLVIAGLGIIFSIIGTLMVKIKDNSAKEPQVQKALNMGNWTSILLTAVAAFFLIDYMLPETMKMAFFGEGIKDISSIRIFGAVVVGLLVGGFISYFTEYYTGLGKKPILGIVQKSSTGAATNIIAGLAVGMISTFSSILLFAAAIWASYAFAGFYGVAIAASAMMATTAMQLAIDAFGPIADNAGGIAEMSELPDEVRERTDILDSVGNTTAATGKGFAIASAALTALALFAAFVTFTGIEGINIFKAPVLAMLFVGGMVPVVFSALAMNSVGKAAMEMVKEVRRQFREIPGIMEGEGTPEYGKCVDISTKAALREMMLPGALTILFPLAIAFVPMAFGMENLKIAEMLGGYMAGVTVSGVLWAIFQNNAGGAWDNAKKSFEAGVEIDGEMTYKGSEAHKAAVTGDTVGDPFKDTSGPSMNILIKLTCLIGLVIAPILGDRTVDYVQDVGVLIEEVVLTPTIMDAESRLEIPDIIQIVAE